MLRVTTNSAIILVRNDLKKWFAPFKRYTIANFIRKREHSLSRKVTPPEFPYIVSE